jgi:hypothetical protein
MLIVIYLPNMSFVDYQIENGTTGAGSDCKIRHNILTKICEILYSIR